MSYDISKLTTQLKISQRIVETPEAVSLAFEIPRDHAKEFRFQPGQFLTLFLEINGELLPRSYSICSAPGIDSDLKVTVKRVPGGVGSNFICDRLKVGDVVRVAPPSGRFYHPVHSPGPHVYLLAAAGSGITPIFSIMKSVLLTEPGSVVKLIYGNRRAESIIYRNELIEWQKRMGDRLTIHHVLSQPPPDWDGFTGRCEGDLLQGLLLQSLPKNLSNVEAYTCGPVGFMTSLKQGLKARGLSDQQIHEESFVTATHPAAPTDENETGGTYIGDANAKLTGPTAKVRVRLSGDDIELTIQKSQTILEGLIEKGENPPYSCLEGNCMACVAKVKSGRVVQRDPGILLDENIASGEVLTCQARPASDQIVIDYDSI